MWPFDLCMLYPCADRYAGGVWRNVFVPSGRVAYRHLMIVVAAYASSWFMAARGVLARMLPQWL